MQMAFYTGSQFPAEYQNDAFVALRGSWNRKPASGYEIVRVRFGPDGRPTAITPFLTGFLVPGASNGGKDGYLGRLCGLAVHTDGSLLFTDDTNNTIYRISYKPTARLTAVTDLLSLQRRVTSTLDVAAQAPASLKVISDAFAPNAAIPLQYSSYGQNISPALRWSGIPSDAKSVVIMMEDPDALNPKPVTHWIVANVPTKINSLPRDVQKIETPRVLGGGIQGANHTGSTGYYGPKPPAAETAHRYHFQVFALDTVLSLPSGFNRPALLTAMRGHVLARGEVIGTYNRE
jgi:Raf kinase inhibitor-like YbhB/YbcL family protein